MLMTMGLMVNSSREYQESAAVANMEHVAVLHNVVLALKPQDSLRACVGFGPGLQQLVPGNGFSPDKMFFQIRVNSAGGGLRARASRDGPGAAFVFANGEKRNDSKQLICFADQPRESAVGQTVTAQKFLRFGIIHVRQFGLDFAANSCSARVLA